MDDRTLRELLLRVQALERGTVRHRLGEVTDDSPLSVKLGGSDVPYTGIQAVGGLQLAVGDVVSCITFGNDLLVLGQVAASPRIKWGSTPAIPVSGVESSDVTVTHNLGVLPAVIYVQPFFASGDSGRWSPVIRTDIPPTSTTFHFFMRDLAGSGVHGPGNLAGTPYFVMA